MKHRLRTSRPRRAAFTLVEVLVATMIVGLISTSVALVISRTFKTRRMAEARTEAATRAKAAAAMIARDLQNAYRDCDLLQTRVQIIASSDKRDQLLLLSRTDHTVRGSATALDTGGSTSPDVQNEAGVHEMQYRIADDQTDAGAPGAVGTSLWKREDPIPDEYLDGGGVATPVVPGVTQLVVEAYDGESWTNDWDSDSLGFPMAVRITVTVMVSEDDSETARGKTTVARQTVAFDRTPLPATFAAAPDPTAQTNADTGTGGTNGNSGTGAGGNQNGGVFPGGGGGRGGRGGQGGGRGGGGRGGGGRGNGGNGGDGGDNPGPTGPGGNGPGGNGPGGGRGPGGPGGGRPPGGGGGTPVIVPGGGGGGGGGPR